MLKKMQFSNPWFAFFALLTSIHTTAFATDIQCNKAGMQRYEEIICEYAILNSQYEEIYKQQEDMIRTGGIQQDAVALWKSKRDLCTDVACMDSAFAEWKVMMASVGKPEAIQRQEAQPIVVQSTSKEQNPSVVSTDAPQGRTNSASDQRQEALSLPAQSTGVPVEDSTVVSETSIANDAGNKSPSSSSQGVGVNLVVIIIVVFMVIYYFKNRGSRSSRNPEEDEGRPRRVRQGFGSSNNVTCTCPYCSSTGGYNTYIQDSGFCTPTCTNQHCRKQFHVEIKDGTLFKVKRR